MTCCRILELRQYTLRPGKREILINLFEREFLDPQEALGMRIVGQFRDLDNPDRFVWLRGFSDMATRAQALQTFYTGPVWKTHREAANATMIDSDNVLLLRPAHVTSGFELDEETPPAPGTCNSPEGMVTATIYYFDAPVRAKFTDFFEKELKPLLVKSRARVLASFVTERGTNNFPALPVRERENVFVWFSQFADGRRYDQFNEAFTQSDLSHLNSQLSRNPEVLRLSPTARSRLRAVS